MADPLDGVRVVDLSRLLPGAYCTLVLADLGADVIKIEDPGGGDLVRTLPPYVDGLSVYHHALNRNKRSVTLDLRAPDARPLLGRLLDTADVVIESFRPRTARRLRVSAADLQAGRPRLVHCSLTGFGQSGPLADRAAHDLNFVALSGMFEVDQPGAGIRRSDASPGLKPGTYDQAGESAETSGGHVGSGLQAGTQRTLRVPRLLVADIGGAWAAVAGILAALFQRERTGRAEAVDIAMFDVAASWLTFSAATATMSHAVAAPSRLPISGRAACYNVYETADGHWLALAAIEQKFWETFCTRAGRPDLVPSQFLPAEQDRLRQIVAAIFRSRRASDWLELFHDADICLTPIRTIGQALEDPQLLLRGSVARLGDSRFIRTPVVFGSGADDGRAVEGSSFHRVPLVPAAALGADTDEVLRAVGLDAATLASLRSRGLV